MVAHQNELTEALMSKKTYFGDRKFEVEPQKYPRFRKFRDRASERAKKTKALGDKPSAKSETTVTYDTNLYAANTAEACGTYNYPKPNVNPPYNYYQMSNPAGWLTSNGFHLTKYYAAFLGSYGNSYTRPTFYSGVQGTCDSPKFRDEGKTETGTKKGWLLV
ncbi:hypothetical protein [Leptolyngbya sp. NIES-2104]|uniref:hypothetical protein n=1 Tax=Leptolyngbya sp. NIES-2104 TaxID=1552121 RepID=UPI00073F3CB9|nr:hypothetical protein [Leptolyngbya sp. NIES-2104]